MAAGQQPVQIIQVPSQTFGVIEHYDPNGPITLTQWYQRFNIFCEINLILPEPTNADGQHLINPNRRRLLFLQQIGTRAYPILDAGCEEDLTTYAIPELMAVLKEHFEPEGLTAGYRLTFQNRLQQHSESVREYVTALQAIAQMCNFGQAYEMSMIGQMIFGIRHNDTRKKIMASGLTWAQVKSIALDEDTQRTQMRSIAQAHLQAQSRNVNAVNAQQAQRAPQQPKPQPQPEPPAQDTHANGGNAKPSGHACAVGDSTT